MCACRQKKSFFIDDILNDVSAKSNTYKNLSQEPTKPLICSGSARNNESQDIVNEDREKELQLAFVNEKESQFNVICEVQRELTLSKMILDQRRNTYPLYPTPVRACPTLPTAPAPAPPTPYTRKTKDSAVYPPNAKHSFSYRRDSFLIAEQLLLKNQLIANGFMSHPLRTAYGFHRVEMSCCSPWWDMRGRRKSRQVRFSAAQTSALEQRFGLSKYLSPDERRAFAIALKLSDRQVKTWYQNRRAKWRRTTPECADASSTSSGDGSDNEVQIADED